MPQASTKAAAPSKHLPAASPSVRSFPKRTCTLVKSMAPASSVSGATVVPEPMLIEKAPLAEMADVASAVTRLWMKLATAASFFSMWATRPSGRTRPQSWTSSGSISRSKLDGDGEQRAGGSEPRGASTSAAASSQLSALLALLCPSPNRRISL